MSAAAFVDAVRVVTAFDYSHGSCCSCCILL